MDRPEIPLLTGKEVAPRAQDRAGAPVRAAAGARWPVRLLALMGAGLALAGALTTSGTGATPPGGRALAVPVPPAVPGAEGARRRAPIRFAAATPAATVSSGADAGTSVARVPGGAASLSPAGIASDAPDTPPLSVAAPATTPTPTATFPPDETPDAATLRRLYAGPPESWPRPWLHAGAHFAEFAPLPPAPALSGRAADMVALGQRLFDDPRLSGSGQIACSSCHNPELGFGDGVRTAYGHDRQRGTRNAPTLYGVAFLHALFWDGRSASLEDQAMQPMTNPVEMAADPRRVARRLNRRAADRAAFDALFGPGGARPDRIVAALAAYERTLRPPRSRYDRLLERGVAAFSDEELRGLHLFRTRAGCANCHNGPLLGDQGYHNLGLTFFGRRYEDLGRYAVTRAAADVGAFRTPSLRGVRRTGPYMHNGLFPTLAGVVNFYAGGGGRESQPLSRTDPAAPRPQVDPLLRRLDLSAADRQALVAFLNTL